MPEGLVFFGNTAARCLALSLRPALQFQQLAFSPNSTAVSGESAIRSDQAVAGHEDRKRIRSVRVADGALRGGDAEPSREVAIRAGLAVRDSNERAPDAALEGSAGRDQRKIEPAAAAREIFRELPLEPVDVLVAARSGAGVKSAAKRGELRREPLRSGEFEQADSVRGRAGDERPQRALDPRDENGHGGNSSGRVRPDRMLRTVSVGVKNLSSF